MDINISLTLVAWLWLGSGKPQCISSSQIAFPNGEAHEAYKTALLCLACLCRGAEGGVSPFGGTPSTEGRARAPGSFSGETTFGTQRDGRGVYVGGYLQLSPSHSYVHLPPI